VRDKEFKNPGRPEVYMRFQSAIVRAIRLFPPIEKKLIVIAELLGYQQWVAELPGVPKGCSSRERVWDEVRNLLSRGERVHVLEFGVAWGYMTKSWFDSQDEIIEKWDGYDRFTGLPRSGGISMQVLLTPVVFRPL